MIEREAVDIVAATEENFFSDKTVFSANEGLMIAVVFVNKYSSKRYGSGGEYDLPPEIGKLVFEAEEWNYDDWILNSIKEIDTHICTEEELNITKDTDNNSAFYRPTYT